MAIVVERIVTALPDLRAFRWSSDERYSAMKEAYAIGRVVHGRSSFRVGRNLWETGPGDVQLKQPGDVHREEIARGHRVIEVVALPPSAVRRGRVRPALTANDPRGAAFHRLHDAINSSADRFTLEVLVTEAIAALHDDDAPSEHTRAVQRAVEMLRDGFAQPITLDALAVHAELDKFHLCRAFRAEVGMPPHAYLTQLRIMHAKALLREGHRPREVAPEVGLYDQSQLNRHFRRIVGTTPGAFANETRARSRAPTSRTSAPGGRAPSSRRP